MGITGTSFFISEQILGEIGGYNELLAGEIDHHRVRLTVWNKVTFLDYWFHDRVSRLLILYYNYY